MEIIKMIPCEETFFLSEQIPENLKVSPKLVEINYSAYSPFKNPDFFYIQKNGHIMIWFYPKTAFLSYPSCINWLIPYIKSNFSGILIKKGEKSNYVFPIRNGIVLSQFIVKNDELKTLVDNLKVKYDLHNVISIKSSKNIISFNYLLVSFFVRKTFSLLKENYKILGLKILQGLIFISLLILILGISKLTILSLEFQKIKKNINYYGNIAKITKKEFFLMERKSKEWKKININYPYFESNIVNLFQMLKTSSVLKVISFDVFYLKDRNEFKVYMNILSSGVPNFLSKLSSLKNLRKIRILDSYPQGNKRVYKILIELSLK